MQKQLSRETLACKSTVITAPSFHCAIPRGIHHPLHLAHSPGSLSQAVGPTEVGGKAGGFGIAAGGGGSLTEYGIFLGAGAGGGFGASMTCMLAY